MTDSESFNSFMSLGYCSPIGGIGGLLGYILVVIYVALLLSFTSPLLFILFTEAFLRNFSCDSLYSFSLICLTLRLLKALN